MIAAVAWFATFLLTSLAVIGQMLVRVLLGHWLRFMVALLAQLGHALMAIQISKPPRPVSELNS